MSKRRIKKPKQVVWQTIIVWAERDVENLEARLAAGDATCLKFFGAAMQWLQMWKGAQDKPPLCLTCEHEFRGEVPLTFLMAFSEDPREKHTVLTGICNTCAAEKSERALLSVGAAGISRVLGGNVIGFDSPTTPTIN